jgi:hypothetical protein
MPERFSLEASLRIGEPKNRGRSRSAPILSLAFDIAPGPKAFIQSLMQMDEKLGDVVRTAQMIATGKPAVRSIHMVEAINECGRIFRHESTTAERVFQVSSVPRLHSRDLNENARAAVSNH